MSGKMRKRRPRQLSELEQLCEKYGFDLQYDDEGQLVIYTGLWLESDESGELCEDPRDLITSDLDRI